MTKNTTRKKEKIKKKINKRCLFKINKRNRFRRVTRIPIRTKHKRIKGSLAQELKKSLNKKENMILDIKKVENDFK